MKFLGNYFYYKYLRIAELSCGITWLTIMFLNLAQLPVADLALPPQKALWASRQCCSYTVLFNTNTDIDACLQPAFAFVCPINLARTKVNSTHFKDQFLCAFSSSFCGSTWCFNYSLVGIIVWHRRWSLGVGNGFNTRSTVWSREASNQMLCWRSGLVSPYGDKVLWSGDGEARLDRTG